jgi:hypothetical protein
LQHEPPLQQSAPGLQQSSSVPITTTCDISVDRSAEDVLFFIGQLSSCPLQQSPPMPQWPSLQQFSIPQQESTAAVVCAASLLWFLQQSMSQHDAFAFDVSRPALIAYAPAVKPKTNSASKNMNNFFFMMISPKFTTPNR